MKLKNLKGGLLLMTSSTL